MCNRSSPLLCQSLPCSPGAFDGSCRASWWRRRHKFRGVTGVLIMDDFPRIVEGKTLKRALGEQYKRACGGCTPDLQLDWNRMGRTVGAVTTPARMPRC